MLCLATIGRCSFTISSSPKLAWKLVSMSAKSAIEPSAPPPLHPITIVRNSNVGSILKLKAQTRSGHER